MPDLQINFRKAHQDDLDFLLRLRIETMQVHLKNAGFNLSEEDHLQRVLYQFENAKIILLDEQVIGLLKLSYQVDFIEIIQIQIDPSQQGKGIGRQVVECVLKEAKSKNRDVKLSVLKRNPAKGLYEKLGFEVVGETGDSFLLIKKKISI